MTVALTQKTCTPCRGGIPPLTHSEAIAFLAQVPVWDLVDEATRIHRTFKLKNFAEALAFVQKVWKSRRS